MDRFEITGPGGYRVICNSAKSAAKLLRELGKDQPAYMEPWSVADFEDFTGKLQHYPKKLLAFLLRQRQASDVELREELHCANNRMLAGMLSGVSKVALSLGIEPERVYRQETRYKSGKPVRSYKISLAFREAAKQNDWPTAEDLRPDDEDEY